MKKIILLITLSLSLFAYEFKTTTTYQKALEIAKQESKLILFMTSIENCPTCDYMKTIVFQREYIINYLNENYIVVIKDIEKQSYPKRFWTRDAPTFYFISASDEKEVREKKVGSSIPETFIQILFNARAIEHNSTIALEHSTTLDKVDFKSKPCKIGCQNSGYVLH